MSFISSDFYFYGVPRAPTARAKARLFKRGAGRAIRCRADTRPALTLLSLTQKKYPAAQRARRGFFLSFDFFGLLGGYDAPSLYAAACAAQAQDVRATDTGQCNAVEVIAAA